MRAAAMAGLAGALALSACGPGSADGYTGMTCEAGEQMCRARCEKQPGLSTQALNQCRASCAVEHMCYGPGMMEM